MESYKISAIDNFLKKANISHKLPITSVSEKYTLLMIGKTPIYARVADTSEKLAKGLMFVEKLGSNEGCLLSFAYDTYADLYMKNCKLNLQTAMIDKQGTITDIINMSYKDPYYIHKASTLVRYALEMSEDFFNKKDIKVGDIVRLL